MNKGIDVSVWQGNVDFAKVKNHGINFVILREGYRQTTDARFFENVKKCKDNDLPIKGIYHFSYALSVNQAIDEALLAINNANNAGLSKKDIVIFFDFEYDTVDKAKKLGVTLTKNDCIAHTKAFCEEVEANGYRAGIYSNIDFYKNWYEPSLFDKYVFWLADWSGDANYSCDYHQYSSKGQVPGISGYVDLNYGHERPKEEKTMNVKAQDILNVARSWIGYDETSGKFKEIIDVYNSHTPLARGYKMKYTDEWCDAFVSACAIKAGAVDIIGTEVGCERHIDIFKKLGIWIENGSITPKAGDIIVFNWDDSTQPNDGWSDHIGFVEQVTGNTIICIEGNKGRSVGRRTINIGWGYIRGFARPKYAASSEPIAPPPLKTIEEVAEEVISGAWGNGVTRKEALTKAGYNHSAVQAKVNAILSEPKKKSTDTVAQEVIAGKWGNGDSRKLALTKAGYDYGTIQNRVNAILREAAKPTLKSTDTIAKEVISGKWGNGADRKRRLTAAGYNYETIQARVNKLL